MLDAIIGAIVILIFSAVALFLLDKKWSDIVAVSLGMCAGLLMFFVIIIVVCVYAVGGGLVG